MYQLTVKSAYTYVRKALDELITAEDIGMLTDLDSVDLHQLVEGYIVEAVYKVHTTAPAAMLEGDVVTLGDKFSIEMLNNGAVTIRTLVPIMRLISMRSRDSKITLTQMVAEDSPQGRMQINEYIRGTYDDPVLVLMKKWRGDHMPRMTYYTTSSNDMDEIDFDIEYLPYPELNEGVVLISPRMEYAVLNQIVAMVLDSFRETDLADRFRAKANEYIGG